MTPAEVSALPEWLRFDVETTFIGGKRASFAIPRAMPAQWYEDAEPMFAAGSDGAVWQLITVEGIRYRLRSNRTAPDFAPKACPACGLLKEGDGRLCAFCHRAARIQLDEDNKL